VRDRTVHAAVCGDIEKFVTALGWRVVETIESPITGGDGNIEFLLGAVRD
jgi:23S rRNA (cytidine1920-2'-O)/16S rRNA (cytidine1409-2'-O)-methyltransferase